VAEPDRAARRTTGRPLKAATTMTVTSENLDGVPDVVAWVARNADAVRMISFQPIAQVGRTEAGLGGGVDVETLWERVGEGLARLGTPDAAALLRRSAVWFGHSACNRMVNGFVARHGDGSAGTLRYHPLRDDADATDVRVVDGFLERFGGISFRLDGASERAARMLGVVLAAPGFVLGSVLAFAGQWLRRLGDGSATRGLTRVLARSVDVRPLVLVSHHFMSRAQLETPTGRERLAHCVFLVPVDGALVSMCEVNATGIREGYYAQLARRGERTAGAPALSARSAGAPAP
jgi:hypothetical protein